MSKFAIGTYSGHQPRLGIWALVNARIVARVKTTLPYMLFLVSALKSVRCFFFIYIKEVECRSVDRASIPPLYPYQRIDVLTVLFTDFEKLWLVNETRKPKRRDSVIGQWRRYEPLANKYQLARCLHSQRKTRNASSIMQFLRQRYFSSSRSAPRLDFMNFYLPTVPSQCPFDREQNLELRARWVDCPGHWPGLSIRKTGPKDVSDMFKKKADRTDWLRKVIY